MPAPVQYVRQPFVRDRFEPSLKFADLIRAQGRDAAESEQRRGDIAAQLWGNLANIVGGIPQQIQQQKAQQQQQAMNAQEMAQRKQQMDAASGQQATQSAARQAIAQIKGGNAEAVLSTLQPEARLMAEEWLEKSADNKRQRETLQRKDLSERADLIRRFGYDPQVAEIMFGLAADDYPEAASLWSRVGNDPKRLKEFVDGYADLGKTPAAQKTQTITVKNPDGSETIQIVPDTPGQTFESAATPKEPKKFQVTVAGPNGQPIQKLVTEEELAAGVQGYREPRAPTQPIQRFQSKEVLGDDGKPVMANYDSLSGIHTNVNTGQPIKNPRPVPSAMEMMDARKFEKSAPVLKGIGELSEKINTQQGLIAKMSGGASKIAAKANYDDDVAEYESMIAGFTPLVARSLGHTGVLTQQDVDSVKSLFPRPGDSKTLRDRKVGRLMRIVGELQSTEGARPAAPEVTATVERDANGKLVFK